MKTRINAGPVSRLAPSFKESQTGKLPVRSRPAQSVLECGGKRSATPLSCDHGIHSLFVARRSKAVSPLRFATAVQKLAQSVVALFCFCLLLSVYCLRASGQTYSIDWYKVSGGGGTSTGGTYFVTGTIGQQDAGGPMTGGNYSLTGGFWALISVVQTPGTPNLMIMYSDNNVIVSWPDPNTNTYTLQQSGNLAAGSGGWTTSSYLINSANGTNSITIRPPNPNFLYFRLEQ